MVVQEGKEKPQLGIGLVPKKRERRKRSPDPVEDNCVTPKKSMVLTPDIVLKEKFYGRRIVRGLSEQNTDQILSLSEPKKVSSALRDVSRLAKRSKLLLDNSLLCQAECSSAKRLLQKAPSSHLVCRDAEVEEITDFIESHVTAGKPGSMYISGPPGTGKTACLLEALKRAQKGGKEFQSVFINCMNVRLASDIYRTIWEKLDVKSKTNEKLNAADFYRKLITRRSMVVICLDEIDQLCDRQSAVLYAAFRWPATANVVLIGIANALDLVDKLLPKLKLTSNLKPNHLSFLPYNKDEVYSILRHRLAETAEMISPSALELCARKVSAVTGDIRKALEVCSLAIDRIFAEEKRKDFGLAPVVNTVHVIESIKQAYHHESGSETLKKLPLQQQVFLTIALRLWKKGMKQFSPLRLNSEYISACKGKNLPVDKDYEIYNICQLLESCRVFEKCPKSSDYKLCIDEASATKAIADSPLCFSFLR